MLAGLVAITAPCAFVTSAGAVLIGAIAGALLVGSVYFVEHKLKIDDPVGAISVHGVNGAWGVLAVGLFADGTYGAGLNGVATPVVGLFYGGGMSQLYSQMIGTLTCIAFVSVSFFAFFKIVGALIGNRVPANVEIEGLDLHEVGVLAYPEFSRATPMPAGVAAAIDEAAPRTEKGVATSEPSPTLA
jgi:Amt family ammonium transporter